MKTMMMKLLGMAVAVLALCQHSSAQNDDDPNGPREPGVAIRMYQIDKQINKMRPLVKGQTPNISKVVPLLDLSDSRDDFKPMEEFFLLNATGFLDVPADGKYEFELTSDDGSILYLNNHEVVNNDFEHSAKAVRGSVDLKKGLVPLEVKFFQGVGNAVLTLKWKTPGAKDFVVVPTSALSCPEGEVRVTSPGVKQIITPLERGRPGDGQPLEGVHPSFTLAQARPDSFHPRVGGIDWLSDGRMVLCLWDADGSVFLLKGAEGNDPEKIEVKRIGAGLAEPLGIKVLHQDGKDHIYVLQKQELTELIDHDGDDIIDEYRCVCNGWNVSANFHEFAFGLVYKDGCFYGNLAIAINPGGRSTKPQVQERGSVMRIHPDGRYEIIANGLRAPNGIGIGVDGEIFVSDNQGDWLPSSKIMHVKEGAFYGQEAVLGDKAKGLKVTPPVVWLPQGEIGNSPSEVTAINIGPWKGQMIHSDVTHGGLKRVFAEKIDGDYQGCVFRFTQGLEAGINRVRFGPDGAIYVGGIGSTGDWGQEGKLKYGLQRLTYNNKLTFEMLAVRAKTNGLEIEFTEPIGSDVGNDPENYYVEQFWYKPTEEYGGPKLDQTALTIKSVSLNQDRTKAFLEIDGIQEGHVQYIRLIGPWKGQDGQKIWSTECWYNMNRIPKDRPGTVNPAKAMAQANTLTKAEAADGWKLLFDGKTTSGWRGYRQKDMMDGWKVQDDCLVRVGQAGDIITTGTYGNFELEYDWKISPGGNSGVIYRVSEDSEYPWLTGPEMQVLDNQRHPDGEDPITSAGSCYGLYAPTWDATYPAGVFNHAKIIAHGNHIEHWINGEKQCEFEIGSDDWKQRVAESKFKDFPKFGTFAVGGIVLQDHGDEVWYRNIKIKELK